MNTSHTSPLFPAWFSRRSLLGGIGALLGDALLVACGGSTGAQPPTPPPPSPGGPIVSTSVNVPSSGSLSSLVPATPAPAASPPAGTMPTITNAENGTTVNLAVGTRAVLALDSSHDWAATVEDPTVLMLVVGAAPSGAQGVYVASKPGQTALTAVGEPLCRKAQPPCGAPTVQFRVRIVVA